MDTNNLLAVPAVAAGLAVVGLTVAQTDQFSRRVLSPEALQAKRAQEYKYRWEQCNSKALLRAHMYVAGGVEAHHQELEAQQQQRQHVSSNIWDKEGLEALVAEWMQQDKKQQRRHDDTQTPFPNILGLSKEEQSREVLLELYHPQSGTYQLPLQKFGMILADTFEAAITTTTMCFVADASSGLGSQMVADMLEASKAGVAIIREPIWMTAFACLVTERVISQDKMQRILFGLCRMEAQRVRDQVGEAKTVLFTLPGQAVTPILLPLLQAAFPEDRHVFAYQSCFASAERAMALRGQYQRATLPVSLEAAISYTSNSTAADPTRLTTPLPRCGITKSVMGLKIPLQQLRLYHADTVEAWIASVDTFFKLKDDEANNGYLPYTLKLPLLLDNPNASLENDTDRYYSLSSLLQFITGCRSRPLPEGVLDAAREWLRDFAHSNAAAVKGYTPLTAAEHKVMEDCAFRHKSILIGDKTLKDTVLPSKHWTLKQAQKRGCACCAPEEEEPMIGKYASRIQNALTIGVTSRRQAENDDDDGEKENTRTIIHGGGYVDGKTTFAFDPTKFSPPVSPTRPNNYVDGKTTFAFDPTKFS